MIRVKLYKRLSTPLGMAEVTLLDTPLDPAHWSKRDEAALDRLETYAARLTDSVGPRR